MARVLITGSSDGIGLYAARTLIDQGHQVFLHARNADRAAQTKSAAPKAAGVLVGDISTLDGMKALAAEANSTASPFDIVIHNAGIGSRSSSCGDTSSGMAAIFAVNSLAPYVLTALMARPKRLIYTSSGLHSGGDASLKDVTWTSGRRFSGSQGYADSKLHNVMLAGAVARLWEDVDSNSVDPGWVKSKLGGPSALGSTQKGADTLVDLAGPDLRQSVGSGQHFAGRRVRQPHQAGHDIKKQDELMAIYRKISGIAFPS
ncbi:MAG: hypothetical protein Q9162_001614 [Coniocarpon cinnabarinum]